MQGFFSPHFTGRSVQVRSTPKPVTPFGGPVCLISLFRRVWLACQTSEATPFAHTTNNAMPPSQNLLAFLVSLMAGP
jgi:hypothetical protein